MKQEYIISQNLDDRPTYKGQRLTIAETLEDNYYELVDKDGNRFLAGEEEIEKAAPQPPQEEMMKGEGFTPGKLTWRSWGETITISNFEGDTIRINPSGDYDKGVPSKEDRQTAERIVECWNGWDSLQEELSQIKLHHAELALTATAKELKADRLQEENRELREAINRLLQHFPQHGIILTTPERKAIDNANKILSKYSK